MPSVLYQGLTFFVSPLEGSAKQVRSAFTCLYSLDNKVLHGLDQDPSLTVFCPVSAAEGKAAALMFRSIIFWQKRSSFVYPSTGLSFEDKLKFLTVFCSLIIEALHRLG